MINFPQLSHFFLQYCSKKIIRFFCGGRVNLINGKLQSIKQYQETKLQSEILSLRRNDCTQKGTFWHSKKAYFTNYSSFLSSLIFFLDMEQLFPVPATLYNKKILITQAVKIKIFQSIQPNKVPRTNLTRS